MTTMIERIAKAIEARADNAGPDESALHELGAMAGEDAYLALARSALEALVEPTKAMIERGMPESSYYGLDPAMVGAEVTGSYRAMIQAALDEKEG